MTAAEIADILHLHALWRHGKGEGSRADLHGVDLRGVDLRNADLRNADFRSADLRNADISRANFSGANIRYADLRNANLSCIDLCNANLSGANLSDADLSGAYLIDADLSGASLRNTDLRGANLSSANFSDADLSGACLIDADLSGAKTMMESKSINEIIESGAMSNEINEFVAPRSNRWADFAWPQWVPQNERKLIAEHYPTGGPRQWIALGKLEAHRVKPELPSGSTATAWVYDASVPVRGRLLHQWNSVHAVIVNGKSAGIFSHLATSKGIAARRLELQDARAEIDLELAALDAVTLCSI